MDWKLAYTGVIKYQTLFRTLIRYYESEIRILKPYHWPTAVNRLFDVDQEFCPA